MEGWKLPVWMAVSMLGGLRIVFFTYAYAGKEIHRFAIWRERLMYLGALLWAMVIVITWRFSDETVWVVRTADLLATMLLLTVVDIHKKIVPDSVLISYLFAQLLMGAYALFWEEVISTMISGVVFALIMLIFSWMTKEKMGMGDAKLLGVLAMSAGWMFAFQVLILGFLLSFLFSMVLLLGFRQSRTTEIPFVPFITAGIVGYLAFIYI